MSNDNKEKMVELDALTTEFLTEGIGDKVLEGITYLFVFNDDKETMERYDYMLQLANETGNVSAVTKEVLSNGCIYDMDTELARRLTLKVMKQVNKMSGGKSPMADFVQDRPEKRRRKEVEDMAKYILKEGKAGKKKVDLAIYSRNREDKIKYVAKKDKANSSVEYKAFNIRKRDLGDVANLCRAQGCVIKNVSLHEILPTRTGVRAIVNL